MWQAYCRTQQACMHQHVLASYPAPKPACQHRSPHGQRQSCSACKHQLWTCGSVQPASQPTLARWDEDWWGLCGVWPHSTTLTHALSNQLVSLTRAQ